MLLAVKNLNCQRGYQLLFSKLSFSLDKSDILRINGENGKGKTSLLRMLAGIGYIEKGTIKLNNYDISNANYQNQLIYLGHLNALHSSLSPMDNLLFLVNLKQSCNRTEVANALAQVGLKYYQDEPCANLSAGQKRRVLLASLLLIKAVLWLLDEPFSALDKQGVRLIEDLVLKHAQQGGACIFTTHQLSRLNQYRQLQL